MTSVFTQIRRRCLKTDFLSSSSSWTPPARDGNLKTHQAPRGPLLKNPTKQRPYDPDRRAVQLDAGTTASTIAPTTSWTGDGLRAKAHAGVARNQRYPDSFAAPPVQSSTERKALPTESARKITNSEKIGAAKPPGYAKDARSSAVAYAARIPPSPAKPSPPPVARNIWNRAAPIGATAKPRPQNPGPYLPNRHAEGIMSR